MKALKGCPAEEICLVIDTHSRFRGKPKGVTRDIEFNDGVRWLVSGIKYIHMPKPDTSEENTYGYLLVILQRECRIVLQRVQPAANRGKQKWLPMEFLQM